MMRLVTCYYLQHTCVGIARRSRNVSRIHGALNSDGMRSRLPCVMAIPVKRQTT